MMDVVNEWGSWVIGLADEVDESDAVDQVDQVKIVIHSLSCAVGKVGDSVTLVHGSFGWSSWFNDWQNRWENKLIACGWGCW